MKKIYSFHSISINFIQKSIKHTFTRLTLKKFYKSIKYTVTRSIIQKFYKDIKYTVIRSIVRKFFTRKYKINHYLFDFSQILYKHAKFTFFVLFLLILYKTSIKHTLLVQFFTNFIKMKKFTLFVLFFLILYKKV